MIWKLDRLGRNLRHLVNTIHDLTARGVGLKVLTGQGAAIDTTTAAGRFVFSIFASLAEFERETDSGAHTGWSCVRSCPWSQGRPQTKVRTPAKLRLAQAAMGKPETNVRALCEELGITRSTLYRHVTPLGQLRGPGKASPL